MQNNYKHKKNFGQHFLHDENVLQNIFIRINNEAKNYDIIEVGAGAGALTRLIYTLKKNRKIMVEIDNDLVEKLSNTFPENELIHKDVLQLNLSEISKNAILVGNFPYNISSQIVFKMIASRSTIHTMVGMFQKEMAKRICAVPGNKDYGIISVLTQAFYDCEYLFDVNKQCFTPPPNVESGVILLKRKSQVTLTCNEKLFVEIVKTTFNNRRKMLRNTLLPFLTKEKLQDKFFEKRPETLSINEFIALTNEIENNKIKP